MPLPWLIPLILLGPMEAIVYYLIVSYLDREKLKQIARKKNLNFQINSLRRVGDYNTIKCLDLEGNEDFDIKADNVANDVYEGLTIYKY